jgi:hypothetical protein
MPALACSEGDSVAAVAAVVALEFTAERVLGPMMYRVDVCPEPLVGVQLQPASTQASESNSNSPTRPGPVGDTYV